MPDDAKLISVKVRFDTHDDNKDWDTQLNVAVKNQKSIFLSQLLAEEVDLAKDQEFTDPSSNEFPLTLKSANIKLGDISVPTYEISINPNGNDRWVFDFTVTIAFDDGQAFSSSTKGIILDQDNSVHKGVFQA